MCGGRVSVCVSRAGRAAGSSRSSADARRSAQALGHESETASRESYISREAITGVDQRRVLTVLAGGHARSVPNAPLGAELQRDAREQSAAAGVA